MEGTSKRYNGNGYLYTQRNVSETNCKVQLLDDKSYHLVDIILTEFLSIKRTLYRENQTHLYVKKTTSYIPPQFLKRFVTGDFQTGFYDK